MRRNFVLITVWGLKAGFHMIATIAAIPEKKKKKNQSAKRLLNAFSSENYKTNIYIYIFDTGQHAH